MVISTDQLEKVFQKQQIAFVEIFDVRGHKLATFNGEQVKDETFSFLSDMPVATYKIEMRTGAQAKKESALAYMVKTQGNQEAGPVDQAPDPSGSVSKDYIDKMLETTKKEVKNEYEQRQIEEREQKIKDKEKELESYSGQLSVVVQQAITMALNQVQQYAKPAGVQGGPAPEQTYNPEQETDEMQQIIDEATQKLLDHLGPDYYVYLAEKINQNPDLVNKLQWAMPMPEQAKQSSNNENE